MTVFNKILVPVDGSRACLNAVCLAARLAKMHGAEMTILHVIDDLLLDQLVRFSQKKKNIVREELHNTAKGFLHDMRGEASKEGLATIGIQIKEGIPHEVIVKEATAKGADLIVIGKTGRRGIGSILLGSVAERVIEFSELPVLIVK